MVHVVVHELAPLHEHVGVPGVFGGLFVTEHPGGDEAGAGFEEPMIDFGFGPSWGREYALNVK